MIKRTDRKHMSLVNRLRFLFWRIFRPRYLPLGVGMVVMAEGIKDGLPFILIRPAEEPGEFGVSAGEPGSYRATPNDTVLFICHRQGADGLIEKLLPFGEKYERLINELNQDVNNLEQQVELYRNTCITLQEELNKRDALKTQIKPRV